MAAIIKVLDETLQLIEGLVRYSEPLVTNDYDNWTLGTGWSNHTTWIHITSAYPTEYDSDATRAFTLERPAYSAQITVTGSRLETSGGATAVCGIYLRKPDSSEVTLYTGVGNTGGTITYLNSYDITPHLNQSGTYTLVFNGYVFGDEFGEATVRFDDVSLTLDTTLPGAISYLVGGPSSMTSVSLQWTASSEATYYKIYYKKTTDSVYLYETSYDLYKDVVALQSGTMYDFYVVGVNQSGEGDSSPAIQARPLGTFTQTFEETSTPTENFAPNRTKLLTVQEVSTPVESFVTQTVSIPPVNSIYLLASYGISALYKFESGLNDGYYDTPDIDYGYPDKDKTLVEIRFRSESPTFHSIVVYVSVDSGATFILVGADVIGLGKTGFVYPWITSSNFLIRFFGAGLQLFSYEVYAIPSGWEIKTS